MSPQATQQKNQDGCAALATGGASNDPLTHQNLEATVQEIDLDQVRLDQLNALHRLEETPVAQRSAKSEAELTRIKSDMAHWINFEIDEAPVYLKQQNLRPEDLEKIKSDPEVNQAINDRLREALQEKLIGDPKSMDDKLEHTALRELMLEGMIAERKLQTAAIAVVTQKLVDAGRHLDDSEKTATASLALVELQRLAEFPRVNPDGTVSQIRPTRETTQRLQVEAFGLAAASLNRYQTQDLIIALKDQRPEVVNGMNQFVSNHGVPMGLVGGSHALGQQQFVQALLFASSLARFSEEANPAGGQNLLNALSHYKIDTRGRQEQIVAAVINMPEQVDKKAILDVLTSERAKKAGLTLNDNHIFHAATQEVDRIMGSGSQLSMDEQRRIDQIRAIFIPFRQ